MRTFCVLLGIALFVSACDAEPGGSGPPDADQARDTESATEDTGLAEDSAGVDAAVTVDVVDDVLEEVDVAPPVETGPLGGDRPAPVFLPNSYDPAESWPLVVLLHGYSASGTLQDLYFGLTAQRHALGFIAIIPNGTMDGSGKLFWNATPACCNFGGSTVDDVGYLWGLVEEAQQRYTVDPNRIYFVGHSNGGFMSYRMACEHGDKIAAIASLAGSSFNTAAECVAADKTSVLQIHGTFDTTIPYGGALGYPGAVALTQRWADWLLCTPDPVTRAPRDLDSSLPGEETVTQHWEGCASQTEVALWTIEGGGHIPALKPTFITGVLDFLLTHPKAPSSP